MKKLFTVLLLGISFFTYAQVNVSFIITAMNQDGIAVDTTEGIFLVGDVTNWVFEPMEDLGDHVYVYDALLQPGDTLSFACNLVSSWDSLGNEDWNYWKRYKEPFDSAGLADCTPSYAKWEGDRWLIVPEKDTTITFSWGVLCSNNQTGLQQAFNSLDVKFYPNPTQGQLQIQLPRLNGYTYLEIYDASGRMIKQLETNESNVWIDLTKHRAGIYNLKVMNGSSLSVNKFMIK